jgi:hypothetical protein
MPNRNAPSSNRYNGWYMDKVNNVLEWYTNGTKIGQASGSTVTMAGSLASTTTITSGTALTVTTGDLNVTTGNVRIGFPSAFATTQPVTALVMKVGTAPAGAVTTSGGLFTDGVTVKKIIADGTVSDVQT